METSGPLEELPENVTSAASVSFPLHPPARQASTPPAGFSQGATNIATNAPLHSSSLSAMRFPFLDGNATDPSQHAGQRVSMFSLKSLLSGQESADPSLPAASPFQTRSVDQTSEDESDIYTADPVSAGLMDIRTAHAHFQRSVTFQDCPA